MVLDRSDLMDLQHKLRGRVHTLSVLAAGIYNNDADTSNALKLLSDDMHADLDALMDGLGALEV